MKKKLVLASGEIFYGEGFGFDQEIEGEVVFNTGMTGYQELISDPSYCGQMVCLTYPLIGNYGINRDDFESMEPAIKGLIVKEIADYPSNFRSMMPIDEFFTKRKLSGISGIDTRKLTRIIRNHGVIKGKIVDVERDNATVIDELKNHDTINDNINYYAIKIINTLNNQNTKHWTGAYARQNYFFSRII